MNQESTPLPTAQEVQRALDEGRAVECRVGYSREWEPLRVAGVSAIEFMLDTGWVFRTPAKPSSVPTWTELAADFDDGGPYNGIDFDSIMAAQSPEVQAAVEARFQELRAALVASQGAGGGVTDAMVDAALDEYITPSETLPFRNLLRERMRDALKAALAATPAEEPAQREAHSDAIAAGDGTLHGAIDYWQARAVADAEDAARYRFVITLGRLPTKTLYGYSYNSANGMHKTPEAAIDAAIDASRTAPAASKEGGK